MNYTISGLNPSTSYDVYLQSDCGAGDTSSVAGPFTFATSIQGAGNITCTTGFPGAAFVDDLEVQGLWTGDFGTGNGVWKVNSGGTTSSATGPAGAHSGNSYFYFETSTGGGTTGTIISPAIDLTSASNDAELSFGYMPMEQQWEHLMLALAQVLLVHLPMYLLNPVNYKQPTQILSRMLESTLQVT